MDVAEKRLIEAGVGRPLLSEAWEGAWLNSDDYTEAEETYITVQLLALASGFQTVKWELPDFYDCVRWERGVPTVKEGREIDLSTVLIDIHERCNELCPDGYWVGHNDAAGSKGAIFGMWKKEGK